MDLRRANKPIHIICPKCKADLQYNGFRSLQLRDNLGNRIQEINTQLNNIPSYQKNKRNALICEKNKLQNKLQKLKEEIHMLSQMSEIRKDEIFKKKVREYIGDKEYIRLRREAEEDFLEEDTYYFYDLAIQNYNNFNGC